MARTKALPDKAKVGFYATSRGVYDKSGRLRFETTFRAVARDEYGRFIRSATAKYPTSTKFEELFNDIKNERISLDKAFSIIEAHGRRYNINNIISGLESVIYSYDSFIPVTDKDRDTIVYLINKFEDPYDFDAFYQNHQDLIKKVYNLASSRTDKEGNILTPDRDRAQITKTLIEELKDWLNVSDLEIIENVMLRGKNGVNIYTSTGLRTDGYDEIKVSNKWREN